MLNWEGTENRTLRHTKSAIIVSSHTFITYAFLPLTPRTTFLPHVSMRKNTRRHAITYSCFVLKHGHAVFLTRWALGAECVKEGLLGRDFDEKWHGLMECDFKLPHLQERRNRPPNFTMMMSAGLHDSVRLKCQVSFLSPPLFFFPSFLLLSPFFHFFLFSCSCFFSPGSFSSSQWRIFWTYSRIQIMRSYSHVHTGRY